MSKKNLMKIIFQIIAVLAVVLAVYFYLQVRDLKKNPNVVAQQEVTSLVAKVGRLVVLPEGETPTVATVSDPEALKDQVFFKNAVKGDKVLIYAESKKAFLYSVSLDKIIDVAPLNIGNQKAVTPPATDTDN
jgi:cell division protein YceG involved in septum cleavage